MPRRARWLMDNPVMFLGIQKDLAPVARYQPRDHVEAGRLARTIRAKQPDHLVVACVQLDLRDDLSVTVGLAQVLRFERSHQSESVFRRIRTRSEGLRVVGVSTRSSSIR